MLWPVLVRPEPMVDTWAVGDIVSPRLTWWDEPDLLPESLMLRGVTMPARALRAPDATTWGLLLTTGGLTAVRLAPGPGPASGPGSGSELDGGTVTVDGCLAYWGHHQSFEQVPRTTATVRRIRTVTVLHDRGTHRWIPRPGEFRTTDVADTSYAHLIDDPQLDEPPDTDGEPDPGSMTILSPEEYFPLIRHLLPERQWQATRFIVDIDVPDLDAR